MEASAMTDKTPYDALIDTLTDVNELRAYLKNAIAEQRRLREVLDYWMPASVQADPYNERVERAP
jgi:hypothetical protein